jgi:hypothetical protein
LSLADGLERLGERELAETLMHRAWEDSKTSGDAAGRTECCLRLSELHEVNGNFPLADQYLQLAVAASCGFGAGGDQPFFRDLLLLTARRAIRDGEADAGECLFRAISGTGDAFKASAMALRACVRLQNQASRPMC